MIKRDVFKTSKISLLIVNVLTIIFAVVAKWDFVYIITIYLVQSIIIGFFNIVKILSIKKVKVGNFRINGVKPKVSFRLKVFVAGFFTFHYGVFHFVYFAFISSMFDLSIIGFSIVFPMGVFFLDNLVSFIRERKEVGNEKQDIGRVMMKPYKRILPMHFIIMFGGFFGSSNAILLVVFMGLKTLSDFITYDKFYSKNYLKKRKSFNEILKGHDLLNLGRK